MTLDEIKLAMRVRKGEPAQEVLEAVLEAVHSACGVKTRIAEHFGVELATVSRWFKRYEMFRVAADEEKAKEEAAKLEAMRTRVADAERAVADVEGELDRHTKSTIRDYPTMYHGDVAESYARAAQLTESISEAKKELKLARKALSKREQLPPAPPSQQEIEGT